MKDIERISAAYRTPASSHQQRVGWHDCGHDHSEDLIEDLAGVPWGTGRARSCGFMPGLHTRNKHDKAAAEKMGLVGIGIGDEVTGQTFGVVASSYCEGFIPWLSLG